MNPIATPLLSVVLAARDSEPAQFEGCVAAFAGQRRAADLELVLIASGTVPAVPAALAARFAGVIRRDVPAEGIYAAYNAGIDAATGRFLLFFGTDDVALDELSAVLDVLELDEHDLAAAPCELEGYGIRRPRRWGPAIVFRNWSHQGIFYRARLLASERYLPRYAVRADHALNLRLLGRRDVRVYQHPALVAYCRAGGLSSIRHDAEFEADLPALATTAFGPAAGAAVRLKHWLQRWVPGTAAGVRVRR
jgi:glycosyltransferase involved in cell wall biosynthesis